VEKAYRANTQSRQVDGLYKPEKFQKKTCLLNASFVDYNILRPVESTSTSFKHTTAPSKVISTIYAGKCH
jgi:hypothetical protein